MSSPPRVVILPRRSRPFFARHPWVFVNSIGRVEGDPAPGAEVEVVSHEGQFIARGLFNPNSAIRVRLYRWDGGPLDDNFWQARITDAVRLRRETLGLGGGDLDACRLVFSESDGLSGLTVDRYGRHLVVQFTSLAMAERREILLPMLAEAGRAEGIIVRGERGIAEQEGLKLLDGPAWGTPPEGPVIVVENGLTFAVDLRGGQKTGFYLDQRDNRRVAATYAKGRKVLDLYCYSGGFGLVAMARGEAASSFGIDSSAPAIALARRNSEANGISGARFEVGESLPMLESLRESGERFGMVVCDPPKFARGPKSVPDALKGYLRLNRAAVTALEPDGVLVTCSCSGLVDRELFVEVMGQVAELTGRAVQILEQRGAAPDHPIGSSCLETDYLTCLICRVSG